jgi:putative ABC transport system substrate-binding protein
VTRAAGLLLALSLPTLAAAPARAQVPVVGYLWLGSPPPSGRPAYLPHLEKLGHREGRTFRLEARWAEGDNSRFPALAREVLERHPAVIITPCGPALRAIREIDRAVPVVAGCSDPKNFLGEVASLSRPGGRTTGFTLLAPESAGKRLQLLKELVPRLSRVGILHHRHDDWGTYLQEMDRAASNLGLTFRMLPIERPGDVDGAFATAVQHGAEALVVFPDAITFGARARIATLAMTHRLPTVFDTRIFVADGGLLSYGPDWFGDFPLRVIATYTDRILRGAEPGDLPIQQPSRLQLVINLRTARRLGLTVPDSLLSRADEIIK